MKSKITLALLLLLAGVFLSTYVSVAAQSRDRAAVIGPEQITVVPPTQAPPGTPIIIPGTPIVVIPGTGDGTATQTLILFGLLVLIVVVVLFVVYAQ